MVPDFYHSWEQILYYMHDVICFYQLFMYHNSFFIHMMYLNLTCPIQCFRYLILNNLFKYVIQMYNLIDLFYISRRYCQRQLLQVGTEVLAMVVTRSFVFLGITACKSKAICVTGCEMSRITHFLDNRLTDRGEVVMWECGLNAEWKRSGHER
jgi:hypothetical protein